MNMRRWGAAVLAASVVGVAGCGGDADVEKAQELGRETQKAYAPLKQDMLNNGVAVGEAARAAEGKADDATATAFTGLTEKTRTTGEAIAALETPESEVPERDALASALDKAADSMDDIAAAAKDGDEKAVDAALDRLLERDVPPIDTARKKWEGALRTLTGSG